MSSPLETFSESLVELIAEAAAGVVAVKAAPYRVSSGVSLPDNLIAVCHHALKREGRVPIQNHQGKEGVAEVLGRDPSVDVAILRTEALTLKPLPIAEPSTLQPGALAAVVGMTADVGPSASLGLVGAVGPARRTWRGGTLDQFLRLEVNLYPSQYGAAVVNAAGQLIGLATPALSRHSTIAVPAATLQRIASELLREGRIRQGYLGIGAQPVAIQASVAAKQPDLPQAGLILLSVEPDSPAETAGLQIGDILLELDAHRISSIEELQSLLRGDAVGKQVQAVVLRGGNVERVALTIAERAHKAG